MFQEIVACTHVVENTINKKKELKFNTNIYKFYF